jgi:hypothetical protein
MTLRIETSVANGVPMEAIVDLCNDIGQPAWLDLSGVDESVAALIVDDVRARLDPGLALHVQYSDKVMKR